jgi:hypothetical protein
MYTLLSFLPRNSPPAGLIPGGMRTQSSSSVGFSSAMIVEKLTGDADLIRIDTYLPEYFE